MDGTKTSTGIKAIIALIYFKRSTMSEMCLWTLNNLILQDKSSIEDLIFNDICSVIKVTLSQTNILSNIQSTKKKHQFDSIKRELFWLLSYITNYNE